MPDQNFDPLLLSQARLGIITLLMTRRDATFSDMKSLLKMTQGNLGIHLKKLEEAGYVGVTKKFVDRKPRTTARITAKGKRAFLSHVEQLERIARDATRGGT